jgi:hypothetical protein
LSSLQLLLHGLDIGYFYVIYSWIGVVKYLEEFGWDGVDSFALGKDRE